MNRCPAPASRFGVPPHARRVPLQTPVLLAALAAIPTLFPGPTHGAGHSSASYLMRADAINNGVGDALSTGHKLAASVGDGVASIKVSGVAFQLANGFRAEVNAPPAVLTLLSVISRKLHGTVPFDLAIDHAVPLNGNVSIEPRAAGAGHVLVFKFSGAVSAVSAVSALDSALAAAAIATVSFTPGSPDVTVTLSNVGDNQRLKVTLSGVNGSATPVTASIGFLTGDATRSGSVGAADIAAIKANSGKAVTAANAGLIATFDLNADGSISSVDIGAAKARSGRRLGP